MLGPGAVEPPERAALGVPAGVGHRKCWNSRSFSGRHRRFCHWVPIALDHFPRRVMGCAVFDKQPSAEQVCSMLDAAVARAGRAPKYTVTDQGR